MPIVLVEFADFDSINLSKDRCIDCGARRVYLFFQKGDYRWYCHQCAACGASWMSTVEDWDTW